MTSAPATCDAPFAIGDYTSAPLRLDMQVRFTNQSPATVFDVMGDPAQIQNWYVLAKDTVVDEQTAEDKLQFEVDFILFGKVREEVMLWNPPQRYVYRAFGEHFPFADYVALIEVEETAPNTGVLRWQQFFTEIEGEDNQRLLSVILPHLNEVSLQRLATMINGSDVSVVSHL
ncbi:MAG: SRPBCC family protein [Luminiphilus sp.]|nr:SRPBCC family protein [Luminiphilus sp.]